MTKVKLGARPKTFKPITVNFELPDGVKAAIEVVYNYRTRSEFGDLMNQLFADAGQERPIDEKLDFKKIFEAGSDKNASHLLASVHSWNVDEALNRETLRQLNDEIPAACVALMEGYRMACVEGRLGN
jgi:hypothetical protein